MFKVFVGNEHIETVMYEEEEDIRNYIRENYQYYGIKARFEKVRMNEH